MARRKRKDDSEQSGVGNFTKGEVRDTQYEHGTMWNKMINTLSGRSIKKGVLGLAAAGLIGYGGMKGVEHYDSMNAAREFVEEQIRTEQLEIKNHELLLKKESDLVEKSKQYLADGSFAQADFTLNIAESLRKGEQYPGLRSDIANAVVADNIETERLGEISRVRNGLEELSVEDKTSDYEIKYGDSLWNLAPKVWSARNGDAVPNMAKGSSDFIEVYSIWEGLVDNVSQNGSSANDLEVGQIIKIPSSYSEVASVNERNVIGLSEELLSVAELENSLLTNDYDSALNIVQGLDGDYSELENRINAQKSDYNKKQSELELTTKISNCLEDCNSFLSGGEFGSALESVKEAEELSGYTFEFFREKISKARDSELLFEDRAAKVDSLRRSVEDFGDLEGSAGALSELRKDYDSLGEKARTLDKVDSEVSEFGEYETAKLSFDAGDYLTALDSIRSAKVMNADNYSRTEDSAQSLEYSELEAKINAAIFGEYKTEVEDLIEGGEYLAALDKLGEASEYGDIEAGEDALLLQKAKFKLAIRYKNEAEELFSAGKERAALDKLEESLGYVKFYGQFALMETMVEDVASNYELEIESYKGSGDFVEAIEQLDSYEKKLSITRDDLRAPLVEGRNAEFVEEASELFASGDFEGSLDSILNGEEVAGSIYGDLRTSVVDSLLNIYKKDANEFISEGNLSGATDIANFAKKRTGTELQDVRNLIDSEYMSIEENNFNRAEFMFGIGDYSGAISSLNAAEDISFEGKYSDLRSSINDKLEILGRYESIDSDNLSVVSRKGESVWNLAETYLETKENREFDLDYGGGDYKNKPKDLVSLANYVMEITKLNDVENPYEDLKEGSVITLPKNYLREEK